VLVDALAWDAPDDPVREGPGLERLASRLGGFAPEVAA
jgi:hypothetical protein